MDENKHPVPRDGYYGHPMFYEILEELKELHSNKNRDYAGDDPLANLRMCERAGVPAWKGVIIRLTDKISRLMTLAKRGYAMVVDETIEDTFKDAAVYSILGLVLYREAKAKAQFGQEAQCKESIGPSSPIHFHGGQDSPIDE